MGTITEKLEYLFRTKEQIKAVIISKGVEVPDGTAFREYVGLINSIGESENVTLQQKYVTPTGEEIIVSPDIDYDGLSSVVVEGDDNLSPENIKKDVTIYGVTGTADADGDGEVTLQDKFVTPTGEDFDVCPDEGYDGLSSVTVEGDSNLRPENIAKGITIYGVTGTMTMGVLDEFPAEFQDKKDQADALYLEKFGEAPPDDFFMLASDGGSVTFGYMTDAFNITTLKQNTEFCAVGWRRVSFRSVTQDWATDDFTSTASTGGNYTKHIRFCTRDTLYYNGNVEVWPTFPVKWSYNGTELPALPEWDKVKYPYVALFYDDKKLFEHYILCTDYPMFASDANGAEIGAFSDVANREAGGTYMDYGYNEEKGGWYAFVVYDHGFWTVNLKPIWANHNIHFTDYPDQIVFAASEPVPVYE